MARMEKIKQVVVLEINYDLKIQDGPPLPIDDGEMWRDAFEHFILRHDWGGEYGKLETRVGKFDVKVLAESTDL